MEEEIAGWPARIRRGELRATDEDDLADRYLIADERLAAAGYTAYEVSNWATARRPAVATIWATGAAITGEIGPGLTAM